MNKLSTKSKKPTKVVKPVIQRISKKTITTRTKSQLKLKPNQKIKSQSKLFSQSQYPSLSSFPTFSSSILSPSIFQSRSFSTETTSTTTTTTTTSPPTTTTKTTTKPQIISLRHILTDLQLDSLIPTIETPPQLQSLLLDQSQHPDQQDSDGTIQLYHLVILSSNDFRTLFPNDVQRNRLKEHVRTIIGGPLLVSDGIEPITRDTFNTLVEQFITKQSAVANAATGTTQSTSTQSTTTNYTTQQQQSQDTNTSSTPTSTTTPTTSTDQTTTQQSPTDQSTTTTTSSSSSSSSESSTTDANKAEKQLAQETLKISIESLKMPQFFDNMKEGSVTAWHVKVGEHFVRNQLLCDIDTDIAELGFEAPEPGHLSEILAQPGEQIKVGDAIAVMRYQEDDLVGKH